MLPDTVAKDIVLGAEMREASHGKLSNAFKNVYPSIYKTIEEGYTQYFQDFCFGTIDDYSNCRHG
jgi:hypothetical protein